MIAQLILVIVMLVIAVLSIRIIRPYEKGIIERLGKYVMTAESGLLFITPFIDRVIKVDMREQVFDRLREKVTTADDVAVVIKGVVYYKVTDPVKMVYNVASFNQAFANLVGTTAKNVVSDKTLKLLTSKGGIANELQKILDDATEKWGVAVTRVELEQVEPL